MNLPLLHPIHRGFDLRDNLNDLEKQKDKKRIMYEIKN